MDAEADLQLLRTSRMLRDDDLGATTVEFGHTCAAVKGLVGDQAIKGDARDQVGTSTLLSRLPGMSRKRIRLPNASVSARLLGVMPPFERPMAWLRDALLRPVRDGEP